MTAERPTACRRCGEPAQRAKDDRGRLLLNLDPTTGLCIPCLVKRTAGQRTLSDRPLDFDPRAAAARNDA